MQDTQAYKKEPHRDAVDCALISKRATDAQKKELFDWLADRLAMLASELERAIEAKGPWRLSFVDSHWLEESPVHVPHLSAAP
jgi:hypothetical protein